MGKKRGTTIIEEKKQSHYIRVKASYKKLRTAQTIEQTVYIYGATGYGKTEMVKHFIGKQKCIYYTCKSGHLMQEKTQGIHVDQSKSFLIIDDLQFLKEAEEYKQVLALLTSAEYLVILISRCPIPAWLKGTYLKEAFVVIEEKDLLWTAEDVARYFAYNDIPLSEEQIEEIHNVTQGNPLAVRLATQLSRQSGYDSALLEKGWTDMEGYLEYSVIEEWDSTMVNFLMQISFLDQFTIPLAEMVTGSHEVLRLLEEARETGNFIESITDGTYRLRTILRSTLMKRAGRMWGSELCREIYYNAGRFYELQDEVVEALAMYEKCQNNNRIRELLIRNARKNPGNGHYFELRRYYLSLTEEEIEKDALLISGMSMLYSLLLELDKSEYWYGKLKTFEKKQTGGIKREAKSRIAYLDIALPHRGTTGILELMKSVPTLLFEKGIALPEFSVTSNMPSVMNGGKDFSKWSKRDRELAAGMGKIVSLVLGRYGKGLVNIALAESLYEKGGDTYEILSLLGRGSLEAETGGKIEMAFAAAGVQVRLNLFHGNEEAALAVLTSFEKKVSKEGTAEILKTIEAMKCRIALYQGEVENVREWLTKAPDEDAEFYILERYRYLTKIRCYLFLGEYFKALLLLEKMSVYAIKYERPLIQIETNLLLSQVQYHMKEAGWQDTLLKAVQIAREYQFYRGISEEGAAIIKMLQDKTFRANFPKEDTFMQTLCQETKQMALQYPNYLDQSILAPPEFGENALKILRLQAEGLSIPAIAGELGMKEATIKYHCKENYKKLGVSGKADAVLAARNLKLL